jgi:hypothetical protein
MSSARITTMFLGLCAEALAESINMRRLRMERGYAQAFGLRSGIDILGALRASVRVNSQGEEIKMKTAVLLSIALLPACASSSVGSTGGEPVPSYEYADIFQVNRDDSGAGDNWVGYGASGSIRVDDHLRLFGEFRSVVNDDSPGNDIDVLAAGFGYHLPLLKQTDLVLDLGFIDEENEAPGSAESSTVLQMGAHVRTRLLGPVELELGLTHYNYGDPDTDFDLGATYHLSDSFGLAVSLADGERRSALRFGARLNL